MVSKCLMEPEVYLSLCLPVNSGNLNRSCLLCCLVSPVYPIQDTAVHQRNSSSNPPKCDLLQLSSPVGLSLSPNTAATFPNKKQVSNFFLFYFWWGAEAKESAVLTCPHSATGQICVNTTFLRQESQESERKNCFAGSTFWGLYVIQFVSKTYILSSKSLRNLITPHGRKKPTASVLNSAIKFLPSEKAVPAAVSFSLIFFKLYSEFK